MPPATMVAWCCAESRSRLGDPTGGGPDSLGFVASATGAGAEPPAGSVQTGPVISLHNASAAAGSDCPAGGAAYWHFVFAPNNGSAAFDSITLNLTTEVVVFSGVPDHPQRQSDRQRVRGRSRRSLSLRSEDQRVLRRLQR